MTPLGDLLKARIAATGPIPVADYMAECLLHPKHGYYATRDPLGAAGDFTTAPEISQMFGECLGLCLAQAWLDQGAPGRFALAELGPGRGTLMADVLRAGRVVPGFVAAAEVHLVEASPVLRARQAETLGHAAPSWHDRIDTLPEAPLYLLANEFFDALPIRQFVRDGAGWRERQVGLAAGALAFGLSAPAPLAALAHRLADTGDGEVVEHCPALPPIAAEIGRRIAAHGGAALIVDYGGWRSRGDTLQAVRAHKYDDVLAHPGAADLTAHVDFEAIARASAPAAVTPMVPQGRLLERLGIGQRAEVLAAALTGTALASHRAALRRLTLPEEMGRVFQSLAIHPGHAPAPPGYA
jgi:SAM-dependent MidA family methyltransferase